MLLVLIILTLRVAAIVVAIVITPMILLSLSDSSTRVESQRAQIVFSINRFHDKWTRSQAANVVSDEVILHIFELSAVNSAALATIRSILQLIIIVISYCEQCSKGHLYKDRCILVRISRPLSPTTLECFNRF